MVQDFLPTIASSGVLLKTIGNASSSIDFVFAMNVRESETFPPLLTPADIACVEEKMSAFRSKNKNRLFATNNNYFLPCFVPCLLPDFKSSGSQTIYEQRFLKDCVRIRLATAPPARSVRFESQIVVTRIAISCSCSGTTLNDGEICAQLNDIEHQHWTGFMGDDRDGLFT